jgi:hypothetical protein
LPTTADPDEEDLIMLTETRTEPSGGPRRTPRWRLPAAAAAAVAVVAVAAGIAITAGDDDDDEGGFATAESSIVFHDDFSDDTGAWDTADYVRVEDGEQVWTISSPGQIEFIKPLPTEYRIVDMDVTAVVASVDPDSTVGVYCRKGSGNQDFYYFFRVAPEGAVIGVLPPESNTPADILAENPTFVRPSGPFEITARCVNNGGVAELTMLVDGQVVAEATHDAPLADGFGAIEVQAGAPGSQPSDVRIDEFTVAAP